MLKPSVHCRKCYCYAANFKPFTLLSLLIRYLCCINISLKVVFYNCCNGFLMLGTRIYIGCIHLKDQFISFSWEHFDLFNSYGLYAILNSEVQICLISYKLKFYFFSLWAFPCILTLADVCMFCYFLLLYYFLLTFFTLFF